MMATILVQIPLAMLSVLQIPEPARDCRLEVLTPQGVEERTLREFDANVRDYIDRRRLARETSWPTMFDAEEGAFGEQLRAAIVATRPQARQGEFFTPAVAEALKDRLVRALLRGTGGVPQRLYEPVPGEAAPEVNKEFPLVLGAVEWPVLFLHLPELPRELGYALWGRDLVLLDVPAALVLDVLPEALPDGAYPGVVYP